MQLKKAKHQKIGGATENPQKLMEKCSIIVECLKIIYQKLRWYSH